MTDRPIAAGLPRRKLVAEWLRQNLLEGKRTQYSIEAAAQRDGLCITTLRSAKFDLGVLSNKESVSGCWYWALPQNQTRDLNNLGGRESAEFDHLDKTKDLATATANWGTM